MELLFDRTMEKKREREKKKLSFNSIENVIMIVFECVYFFSLGNVGVCFLFILIGKKL